MENITEFIKQAVTNQYNRRVYKVQEAPGGWSALAFEVYTDTGQYFAKVYDKRRPSTQQWVQRIATYMPVALWLSNNTLLKDSMIAPVLTNEAAYKVENDKFVLLLFPFLKGQPIGERKLTQVQTHQLASILSLLHSYNREKIPIQTEALAETYNLFILDHIHTIMFTELETAGLQSVIHPYSSSILKSMDRLQRLAKRLQPDSGDHRLCHCDIHGWNLMWTDRLVLIDWEGIQLAPVESDLFSFSKGFFFSYAEENFFRFYKAMRPEYIVNETALDYYRLRRRLTDIAEFAQSIIGDGLTGMEREQSLFYLQKECAALNDI